jgi:hypothetical protein
MSHKNEDIKKQMHKWELQQKQESQQDLRELNEHMNDKYQQMKNNYISFTSKKEENNGEVYSNDSNLADKNSYMQYELNNNFDDKEHKKK